jgi:hypothetical protein
MINLSVAMSSLLLLRRGDLGPSRRAIGGSVRWATPVVRFEGRRTPGRAHGGKLFAANSKPPAGASTTERGAKPLPARDFPPCRPARALNRRPWRETRRCEGFGATLPRRGGVPTNMDAISRTSQRRASAGTPQRGVRLTTIRQRRSSPPLNPTQGVAPPPPPNPTPGVAPPPDRRYAATCSSPTRSRRARDPRRRRASRARPGCRGPGTSRGRRRGGSRGRRAASRGRPA